MREGYSPEAMQLAQEHLESMTIREEETEHGFQHVDAEGRVILKTETYADTQTVQYEYGEGRTFIENGKITAGEHEGKVLRREHPFSDHEISIAGYGSLNATLETIGETTDGGEAGSAESWAHFEVTDQAALQIFSAIPEAERKTNERGESYAVLNGNFGGGFEMTVGSRRIVIDSIGRVSVNFDADGRPTKATIHKIIWHEANPEQ